MRRLIAATMLASTALIAAPADAQGAKSYVVEGWCGGSPHYKGTVTLTGDGQTYDVTWSVAGEVFRGRAIAQEGDLAISFTQNGSAGVMHTRRSGAQWFGVWTTGPNGGACVENWTPRA